MSLTAAQLEMRRTGIGSTDIVRLSGESPFGTLHDVYREKVSNDVSPQTESQSLGHRLEPIVCDLIAEKFGLELAPNATERHPILSWALSTPDRAAMRDGRRIGVVEAKLVGFAMASHWEDEAHPPTYVHIQAQWHMTVTRTPVCYVGGLIGTEFRSYEVAHDEDLSCALQDVGNEFWMRHVLPRIPPPPDGSEAARRMIKAAWPRASKGLLIASAPIDKVAIAYLDAKEREAEWAAKKDLAEQQLCVAIGEYEGIEGDGWKVTWREQPPVEVKAHIRKATRVFRMTTRKVKAA